MRKLLLLLLLLIPGWASAQSTVIFVNCSGTNDTAAFSSILGAVGVNPATIHLPYKTNTAQRCAVNTLTIPANVTLSNENGSGIKVNTGQTLTVLGPIINVPGKAGSTMFFGPGTVNFAGNAFIGTNGQALLSDGLGGTSWGAGGGGGGDAVASFEGRTGAVVSAFGDYNWSELNLAGSSLADLSIRSASELSNGTTGTGQVVLHDSPSVLNLTASTINKVAITAPATSATLTIANGKTLAVNHTMTLAGNADGQSILFPASGTVAMSADTLGVSTINATGAAHTHAIASSANPGAAASLLATNSSGHLQLLRLGIGTAPTQPLEVGGNVFINAATANLFLKDTSTGLQAATTGVITPQNNNSLRSTSYTSGLTGWDVSAIGNAEFNNISVRGEIRSSVFRVDEATATAGTFGVFFSASSLSASAVIPASGSFTFNAKNSDAGGMLFAVGDIVRFKGLSTTGSSDTWATITARTNGGTTTAYTATFSSGTASTTYVSGTAVIDYGPSGTGFITLSADGTVGATPNLSMATHAGAPWSALTTRARLGNLNGSYGYATDVYGFGAGQYGTAGQSWLTVDPVSGVRIGNNTTVFTQLDNAGNASFSGSVTASSGTIAGWSILSNRLSSSTTHIASGFDVPSGQAAWFGRGASNYAGLSLVDSASRAIQMLVNDGTTFPYLVMGDGSRIRVVVGGLNKAWGADGSTNSMGMKIWDSAGAKLAEFSDFQNIISGWSIGSAKISSTGIDLHSGANAALAFGTTPPTSASAGTGIWLDRTGLYGLASAVVQAKIDATTGALVAGAGNVTADVNGIQLNAATGAINTTIKWIDPVDGSPTTGSVLLSGSRVNTPKTTQATLHARSLTADTDGNAITSIIASNSNFSSTAQSVIELFAYGPAHATRAGKRYVSLSGADGILVENVFSNTVPAASTALEVKSTTGAFLPPKMTTTQRDALTPTAGHVIWNTTTTKLQVYTGAAWVDLH